MCCVKPHGAKPSKTQSKKKKSFKRQILIDLPFFQNTRMNIFRKTEGNAEALWDIRQHRHLEKPIEEWPDK